MEIFKQASKRSIRFETRNGHLSTEDLWGLSLQSLDSIAKAVNGELKASSEESFISAPTQQNTELTLKLEILKAVIADKIESEEAASKRAANSAKAQQLRQLIADKKNSELAEKTSDELEAMLAEIE